MSNELMERPTETAPVEKWNDRLEAFVEAYVGEARYNATEAARMVGYSTPHVSGWNHMQRNDVKLAIKQRTQATAMHADELLMLLGHEARGTAIEYVDTRIETVTDPDGNTFEREVPYVDVKRMRRDGRGSLLKKITRSSSGVSYEFVDPLAAQAILVKVHNLVPETNAIDNAIADGIRARVIAELARTMAASGQVGQASASPLAVSGTTDVVIETVDAANMVMDTANGVDMVGADGVDGSWVGDAAEHATGDATVDGQTRAMPASVVQALTLGICVVCGDRPADKVSKSGAGVCSTCVPG